MSLSVAEFLMGNYEGIIILVIFCILIILLCYFFVISYNSYHKSFDYDSLKQASIRFTDADIRKTDIYLYAPDSKIYVIYNYRHFNLDYKEILEHCVNGNEFEITYHECEHKYEIVQISVCGKILFSLEESISHKKENNKLSMYIAGSIVILLSLYVFLFIYAIRHTAKFSKRFIHLVIMKPGYIRRYDKP